MLARVQARILEAQIPYTGKELSPHWGLQKTGVYSSLITAFTGPCEVPTEHLVDQEDRLAGDFIRSKQMLHLIGEFYGTTLEAGVLYQRLLIVWTEKLLREEGVADVRREGDDLMIGEGKLSVSIATASNVSVLIHWGFNIETGEGAPVKTADFQSLGWGRERVLTFAKKLLTHYIGELEDIHVAQCKVRPV